MIAVSWVYGLGNFGNDIKADVIQYSKAFSYFENYYTKSNLFGWCGSISVYEDIFTPLRTQIQIKIYRHSDHSLKIIKSCLGEKKKHYHKSLNVSAVLLLINKVVDTENIFHNEHTYNSHYQLF